HRPEDLLWPLSRIGRSRRPLARLSGHSAARSVRNRKDIAVAGRSNPPAPRRRGDRSARWSTLSAAILSDGGAARTEPLHLLTAVHLGSHRIANEAIRHYDQRLHLPVPQERSLRPYPSRAGRRRPAGKDLSRNGTPRTLAQSPAGESQRTAGRPTGN